MQIELRTTSLHNAGQIECEDYGVGITESDWIHVFDPFFTTKPVGSGTGLGLAVAYGIIRDHGGSIEVDSQQASGTRCRSRLPSQPTSSLAANGTSNA